MNPTSQPNVDAAPPPGSVIAGKYRVDEVLGKGGMGIVVRATHLQLGEPVALKFLHGQMARDPDYVERFLREARAAVRIKSEHVARVFDVGTLEDGAPYIVMELLVGQDLHHVGRERGPLPVADALDYVIQACRALAEAHHLTIVHRDLKPANLFLTRRGDGSALVKVLDFGISKTMDGSDQNLTSTGDVLGSPLYMSPEQIRDSRRVDARSDIWSLGNILYRLLSGRAPFAADTSAATLARIVADASPMLRLERPDISPELEAVVQRCLEKRPENRYQRVEDLAAALSEVLQQASRASGDGWTPGQGPRISGAPQVVGQGQILGRRAMSGTLRMDGIAPIPLPPGSAAQVPSVQDGEGRRLSSSSVSGASIASRTSLDPGSETTGTGSSVTSGAGSARSSKFAAPIVIVLGIIVGAAGAIIVARSFAGTPAAATVATVAAASEVTQMPSARPTALSPSPSVAPGVDLPSGHDGEPSRGSPNPSAGHDGEPSRGSPNPSAGHDGEPSRGSPSATPIGPATDASALATSSARAPTTPVHPSPHTTRATPTPPKPPLTTRPEDAYGQRN